MASHEKDKGTQHGSGKPSDINKQQEQHGGKAGQAGAGSEKTRHMDESEKGKTGGHSQRR